MRRYRALILFILAAAPLSAGQDDVRQICDSAFRQKRPQATTKTETHADARVDYRVNGASSLPATAPARVIGFTLWRLRRPAGNEQEAPRLLVQDVPGQT